MGLPMDAKTAMDETKDGAFVRSESGFRDWIGSKEYPAEAGRYHLYVSYACPWASRCLMVRALKGLDEVISVSVVAAVMQKTRPGDDSDKHHGWVFNEELKDPIFGAKTIREIYEHQEREVTKFTVPILLDKKTKKIVSNESSEIIRMFNDEFNKFAKEPKLDLYPKKLRKEIESVNDWIYPSINNGVYKCGFATKQAPYDKAVNELFEGLDKAEELLSKRRYIAGDQFTEADVRLFVTLVRFDEVYVQHFKTNKARIIDYPNLRNYVREVYQMSGPTLAVADTVDMEHIKTHYMQSHPTINKYGIVAAGPNALADFRKAHDRERKY